MWLRRRYANIFLSLALIYGCADVQINQEEAEIPNVQTCDSCAYALMPASITSMTPVPQSNVTFSTPVAIAFFPLANDHELYDSLNMHERISFYDLQDQMGIYASIMRPVLDSMNITVIEGLPDSSYIMFKNSESISLVYLKTYRYEDGILLFKPGKKPVFLQEWRLNSSCMWSTVLHCYFEQ